MAQLWGPERRFRTWRGLWIALAEAEQQLGIPISDGQLEQLRSYRERLNLEVAAEYERKLRHDVMAHVHAYGDQCPDARKIIHLGATSCFITDNADLVLIREALGLVARRLAVTVDRLGRFAAQYRALPCLAFTHLQPAQPTTVGKRACLWAYDLALDLHEIDHRVEQLRCRSVKGTTGTQASFLQLFGGDHGKVLQLERLVAAKLGFDASYAVTGQTYPPKSGQPNRRRPVGDRPKSAQDRHRLAAARRSQGARGTVRAAPDRQLSDGIQTQPDAERADLRPGPLRDHAAERSADDGLDAVDGADT